ncbi:MAG: hypothetical protein V1798_07800 [Pseudomonadota bacterium]
MKAGRLWIAAIAAIVLCAVARCAWEARREYSTGRDLMARGEALEGILHLDRAIHWYFPGNPFVGRSIRALWAMGQEFEGKDGAGALRAYEAIRGGLYAVAGIYQPYPDWLSKANERIAVLRAREEATNAPPRSMDEALAYHRGLLEQDERPKTGWALVVEMGFLGWLASAIALIWRGYDAEGRMNLRRSVPWMAALTFFFAIWVLGLLKA